MLPSTSQWGRGRWPGGATPRARSIRHCPRGCRCRCPRQLAALASPPCSLTAGDSVGDRCQELAVAQGSLDRLPGAYAYGLGSSLKNLGFLKSEGFLKDQGFWKSQGFWGKLKVRFCGARDRGAAAAPGSSGGAPAGPARRCRAPGRGAHGLPRRSRSGLRRPAQSGRSRSGLLRPAQPVALAVPQGKNAGVALAPVWRRSLQPSAAKPVAVAAPQGE
jgi:hypothetical protein